MSTTVQRTYGSTSDPAEFVSLAEQATNAYDTEAALALYATVEVIADGAREEVTGLAQIEEALRRFTVPLRESGYAVQKNLLCAGEDLIVNEWRGRYHGGAERSIGIEIWRFDATGKVREHRLHAYFDVRPSTSPIAGLRLALGRPSLAVRLLRARIARRPG